MKCEPRRAREQWVTRDLRHVPNLTKHLLAQKRPKEDQHLTQTSLMAKSHNYCQSQVRQVAKSAQARRKRLLSLDSCTKSKAISEHFSDSICLMRRTGCMNQSLECTMWGPKYNACLIRKVRRHISRTARVHEVR